ncbi:hypothetical protein K435DRAFT_783993 [Dendrothele bispora CBS 962.96]|uniref:P-loop containing nucleoside triphosphate hydrolase protein n=1 Tax=Dendrothele bispora (strain CBS 962.96) TaxID=1314807 RepID=A0A4S8L650_DENBC|nr:hypothetical protein K435DRAFT_783993 [Dendrothele bispora CBS 962.96]
MPRIRKKTSKRGTTNDKRKIHNKIREGKKKKAKQARKNPNPQWKSKHKKDPGIPNNFPFKDQILAEVAEQRRLVAEEKQRRKDAKKVSQNLNTEEGSVDGLDNEENDLDDDEDFEGVANIGAKRLITAKAMTKPTAEVDEEEDDEDEDVPILINRDLPHLQAVLDRADVVIQILDARDPLSFRSSRLEEVVAAKPGKRMIFVLNKIDTCPQESVAAWASVLRQEYPTFLFRSASSCLPGNPLIPANAKAKGKGKGKAKEPSDDAVGLESVLEYIGHVAKDKESTTIAVVGLSNVGKSSFVNSLLKKKPLAVYSLSIVSRGPTTTTLPQDVTLNMESKKIQIIDTPGLMWEVDKNAQDSETLRARDILLCNKGRIDRLKDPSACVSHLVSRSSAEDLMLLYALPTFVKGDLDSFLSGMARSQQLVKKKGVLDLAAASKTVLRDWNIGKIHWYSAPPGKQLSTERQRPESDDVALLNDLYGKDASIVSILQPKKVLRKAVGLIRLTPGEVDQRQPRFERSYEEGDTEDSSDEGDDGMEVDQDISDDSEEGEDEEDGDEDEDGEDSKDGEDEDESNGDEVPSLLSGKQKRKLAAEATLPPSKKVAFTSNIKSRVTRTLIPTMPSVKPKPALKTKPGVKKISSTPVKTQKVASDSQAYDFGKFF